MKPKDLIGKTWSTRMNENRIKGFRAGFFLIKRKSVGTGVITEGIIQRNELPPRLKKLLT